MKGLSFGSPGSAARTAAGLSLGEAPLIRRTLPERPVRDMAVAARVSAKPTSKAQNDNITKHMEPSSPLPGNDGGAATRRRAGLLAEVEKNVAEASELLGSIHEATSPDKPRMPVWGVEPARSWIFEFTNNCEKRLAF